MQITPQNYKKLLSKIQATIVKTKKNIVKSVDRQKVEMSWQIGRDIDGELKGKERSKYGEELIKQLTHKTLQLQEMHSTKCTPFTNPTQNYLTKKSAELESLPKFNCGERLTNPRPA